MLWLGSYSRLQINFSLQLYLQNKDSMTLIHYKFKTSPLVTTLLLTHTFIYVADIVETHHRILVFSTRLSEAKKSEAIVGVCLSIG